MHPITPVTISRAVKDGFSLTQGLQKELTVGSSKIHRFCENCALICLSAPNECDLLSLQKSGFCCIILLS